MQSYCMILLSHSIIDSETINRSHFSYFNSQNLFFSSPKLPYLSVHDFILSSIVLQKLDPILRGINDLVLRRKKQPTHVTKNVGLWLQASHAR